MTQPTPEQNLIEEIDQLTKDITTDAIEANASRLQIQMAIDVAMQALKALNTHTAKMAESMARLTATADELADNVEELGALIDETTPDPEPEPLIRVPRGMTPGASLTEASLLAALNARPGSSVRGTAPFKAHAVDVVEVRLAAEDQTPAHGSATGTHEIHLPYETPTSEAEASVWVNFVDNDPTNRFDPGQTGKILGLVSFDGNWNEWPGGGRHGPANCSVRAAHWWWDRRGATDTMDSTQANRFDVTSWRPSLYIYTGTAYPNIRAYDHNGDPMPINHISNDGHTTEIVAHRWHAPLVNTPQRWEVRASSEDPHNGSASLHITGKTVLTVEGIDWVETGEALFNRDYLALAFGGGPTFAPRNPQAASTLRWSGLKSRSLA